MIFDVSLTEYEDLKVVASLLAVSPQIKHLVFILKVQLTQITKFISYNLLKNYPLIIWRRFFVSFFFQEYVRHDILHTGWAYFKRIFPACVELKEVEIHGFIKPANLGKYALRMSCYRKANLVKLLMKKSMKLEKITVHVDKYINSAPTYIEGEFRECLRRIQRCGGALLGPTSINIVYSWSGIVYSNIAFDDNSLC